MKRQAKGRVREGRGTRRATVRRRPPVEEIAPCATAVAMEALRTGVPPARRPRPDIPREEDALLVGDPDDRLLSNEYVGDDVPGGSTPTPDQNTVDAIGRAYGVQEGDSGALRTSVEILGRRDRHRAELTPEGSRRR